MREKKERFIVTFRSTTDAMAMEKKAREERVPGRMIPVPRSIAASCGLSWMAEPADEQAVREAVKRWGIEPDGFYHREML